MLTFVQFWWSRLYKKKQKKTHKGAMDLPEETTDANALSWSAFPLHEEGGWKWHVFDGLDIQFKMNSDNTVMRMCNFKDKKVRESGDPTANMSYFLAKSRAGDRDGGGGSGVAPGFDPPPVDRTIKKHKELNVIIGGKNNKFRSTSADSGPIEIKYKAEFKEVLQVDTENEMFGAIVVIWQEWAITRPDAADYVASTDRRTWVPKSFMPPRLQVHNEAKDPTHLEVTGVAGRCKLHVRSSDNMVVVKRKLEYEGDFWEPFELESYPFDVQPLKVVLRTDNMKQSSCEFVYMPKAESTEYSKPRDTEWWIRSTDSSSSFKPELEEEESEIDDGDDDYAFGSSDEDEDDNISLLSQTMEENDRVSKLEPKKMPISGAAPTLLVGETHTKMEEPPLSPFPGMVPTLSPTTTASMNLEISNIEANADAAAAAVRKVGFLDVAGTVGQKVKRRRAKRQPMLSTRSASLFDPLGAIELTIEAVVQRYYNVHIIRVVVVMALFSLTSIFSLSMDPEVHCLDRFALLVTLLLTASTYQITIAAELPALGYLTFIDKYVLITFFFIFLIIIEVAVAELVPATNDKSCDYNFSAERCDPTEMRMTVYGYFMIADVSLWVLMHAIIMYWTTMVIIPYEQNKTDVVNRGREDEGKAREGRRPSLQYKRSKHSVWSPTSRHSTKPQKPQQKKKKHEKKMSPVFEEDGNSGNGSDGSEISVAFVAAVPSKKALKSSLKKHNQVSPEQSESTSSLQVPGGPQQGSLSLTDPKAKKRHVRYRNSLDFPPGIEPEPKKKGVPRLTGIKANVENADPEPQEAEAAAPPPQVVLTPVINVRSSEPVVPGDTAAGSSPATSGAIADVQMATATTAMKTVPDPSTERAAAAYDAAVAAAAESSAATEV